MLCVRLPAAAAVAAFQIRRTGLLGKERVLPPLRSVPQQRCFRPRSPVAASMAYEKELEVAKRAVRLASGLCRLVQRRLKTNEKLDKEDDSPVTIADFGAQAIVSWALQQAYPDAPISLVAEEDSKDLEGKGGDVMTARIVASVNEALTTAGPDGSAIELTAEQIVEAIDRGRSNGGAEGRHWVLDPIDGTRGFVRGDQYAVALGMIEDGKVVLGVLGCPNLPVESLDTEDGPVGCIFAASKGCGTILEPLDGGQARKVQVSNATDPKDAKFCESFEARHSDHSLSSNIARKLGVTAAPYRVDSQAKYGAMARGDATIYMRLPKKGYVEKIWDHAAGSIVIEEAGGCVMDVAGKPLDFSKGRFLENLDTGILATNPALKDRLLATVKECLAAQPV
eukprot:jgi/Chlat1/2977/Chrsp2S04703